MLGFKRCLPAISKLIQLNSSQTKISSQRKHFKESMAAKGVFCFVLISAIVALATSQPAALGGSKGAAADVLLGKAPPCECFNPFLGTTISHKGDSDKLCGAKWAFCYVPCSADCSDIEPTSNASRCTSTAACANN